MLFNVRGYRVSFLESSSVVNALEAVDRGGGEGEKVRLSAGERETVRERAGKVDEGVRKEFMALYEAWKGDWLTNPRTMFSNDTRVTRELEEFPRLVAMGEEVIPLIVELLMEDAGEHFVLLVLYDELQEDESKVVRYLPGDPSWTEGEQTRALRTVKRYAEE